MSEQTKRNYSGISFGSALGLVFITLKLTGHITWSWWWVLSPFWIPFAILLPFIVLRLAMHFPAKRRVFQRKR